MSLRPGILPIRAGEGDTKDRTYEGAVKRDKMSQGVVFDRERETQGEPARFFLCVQAEEMKKKKGLVALRLPRISTRRSTFQ